MVLLKNALKTISYVSTALIAAIAFAEDAPKFGPEFGEVNVVLTDKSMHAELRLPANSVVGFSGQPKNDAQKEKVKKALADLQKPAGILSLPEDAKCKATDATVATELFNEQPNKEKPEIWASYAYTCADITKLKSMAITLFSIYKSGDLLVNVVSTEKQITHKLKIDKDAAESIEVFFKQ